MIIGRLIGWLILLSGLAIEGRDLLGWYDTGHYKAVALGELWFQVDRNSLLLVQPAIERYIAAWPWDSVIAPMLQFPAALSVSFLGFVLIWLFRRREHRRRR